MASDTLPPPPFIIDLAAVLDDLTWEQALESALERKWLRIWGHRAEVATTSAR